MKFLKDLLKETHAGIYEDDNEEWPKLVSKADNYRVEIDENEQIYLKTRSGKVLVKMPYVIWTQLTRG
jgi:hypothetical protein